MRLASTQNPARRAVLWALVLGTTWGAAPMVHADDVGTLVILGARGDLAGQKLVPALHELEGSGALPKGLRFVGVGRQPSSTGAFREWVRSRLPPGATPESASRSLAGRASYVGGNLQDPATTRELAKELKRLARSGAGTGKVLFYLALPAELLPTAIQRLHEANLIGPRGPPGNRLIVEKPFGSDLDSAAKLDRLIARTAGHERVDRVDHFLAKKGVLELLRLRAEGPLEDAWSRAHVQSIEIRAREKIGVGERIGFYDGTGALRDMVQSHLLQLAALAGMERPQGGAEAWERARTRAIESLRVLRGPEVDRNVLRGQYVAGGSEPGYAESMSSGSSDTETYVAVRTRFETGRLAGVPVLLETGKGLEAKRTEVKVRFRRLPSGTARSLGLVPGVPATLTVAIDPAPGITIRAGAREVSLSMEDPEAPGMQPYGSILREALQGRRFPVASREQILASWSFVDAIRDGWRAGRSPLRKYVRGGHGPRARRMALDAHERRRGFRWNGAKDRTEGARRRSWRPTARPIPRTRTKRPARVTR